MTSAAAIRSPPSQSRGLPAGQQRLVERVGDLPRRGSAEHSCSARPSRSTAGSVRPARSRCSPGPPGLRSACRSCRCTAHPSRRDCAPRGALDDHVQPGHGPGGRCVSAAVTTTGSISGVRPHGHRKHARNACATCPWAVAPTASTSTTLSNSKAEERPGHPARPGLEASRPPGRAAGRGRPDRSRARWRPPPPIRIRSPPHCRPGTPGAIEPGASGSRRRASVGRR